MSPTFVSTTSCGAAPNRASPKSARRGGDAGGANVRFLSVKISRKQPKRNNCNEGLLQCFQALVVCCCMRLSLIFPYELKGREFECKSFSEKLRSRYGKRTAPPARIGGMGWPRRMLVACGPGVGVQALLFLCRELCRNARIPAEIGPCRRVHLRYR